MVNDFFRTAPALNFFLLSVQVPLSDDSGIPLHDKNPITFDDAIFQGILKIRITINASISIVISTSATSQICTYILGVVTRISREPIISSKTGS